MQVDTIMECILLMGSNDGNPEWFGYWKFLSHFLKYSTFIQDHSVYPTFWVPIGFPVIVTINTMQ